MATFQEHGEEMIQDETKERTNKTNKNTKPKPTSHGQKDEVHYLALISFKFL